MTTRQNEDYAFANSPHELSSDITDNPRDSAFFKAMQLCKGVLVVLDRDAKVLGLGFAKPVACVDSN